MWPRRVLWLTNDVNIFVCTNAQLKSCYLLNPYCVCNCIVVIFYGVTMPRKYSWAMFTVYLCPRMSAYSIRKHFYIRLPRSDPISYWLTYCQIARLTLTLSFRKLVWHFYVLYDDQAQMQLIQKCFNINENVAYSRYFGYVSFVILLRQIGHWITDLRQGKW